MTEQGRQLPPGTPAERWVRLRRRFEASGDRVFRAWSDPEELARWYPERVEGALAVGTRSTLVWPEARVWWDVLEAQPARGFVFRRPWHGDEDVVTTVRIVIDPAGYGSLLLLEDGPYDLEQPGALDAWAARIEEWSTVLAMLRAYLDFSVDIRQRR